MKNYAKIFTWGMIGLIAVSVIILIWGFIAGWTANDGLAVDVLLDWAYVMVILAVLAVIGVGLVISIKNDPKSLVKIGVAVAGTAVLCLVAFLFAKGDPAMGLTTLEPSKAELKLTDTILNLTYIVGVASVVAIIVGEIRVQKVDKKK